MLSLSKRFWCKNIRSLEDYFLDILFMGEFNAMIHDFLVVYYFVWLLSSIG